MAKKKQLFHSSYFHKLSNCKEERQGKGEQNATVSVSLAATTFFFFSFPSFAFQCEDMCLASSSSSRLRLHRSKNTDSDSPTFFHFVLFFLTLFFLSSYLDTFSVFFFVTSMSHILDRKKYIHRKGEGDACQVKVQLLVAVVQPQKKNNNK